MQDCCGEGDRLTWWLLGYDNPAQLKAMAALHTYSPRVLQLNRVQWTAYQRQVTRRRAFTKWAEEWHAEHLKGYGRDSFTYEYALTEPSSRQNHPLESSSQQNRRSTLLLPPPHNHCSMACWRARIHNWLRKTVQTRHTRFIWRREPLLGSLPDHFHHILHNCPRYTAARLSAGGHWQWDDEFELYYFRNFIAHDNSLISYRCREPLSCPHSGQRPLLNHDDCPDRPQT